MFPIIRFQSSCFPQKVLLYKKINRTHHNSIKTNYICILYSCVCMYLLLKCYMQPDCELTPSCSLKRSTITATSRNFRLLCGFSTCFCFTYNATLGIKYAASCVSCLHLQPELSCAPVTLSCTTNTQTHANALARIPETIFYFFFEIFAFTHIYMHTIQANARFHSFFAHKFAYVSCCMLHWSISTTHCIIQMKAKRLLYGN